MSTQRAEYVWFNGKIVPWNEAKVHVLTHAFNYGTAAFEGIRAYPYGDELFIFRLADHIKRLFESAKIYGFQIGYTHQQIIQACIDVAKTNNFHEKIYIRPLVYVAGVGIGIGFTNQPVGVAIAAVPFESYFPKKGGVDTLVSSWRRIPEQSLPPSAKITGHYANSVLGKMDALTNGYNEAIMLDITGRVSEGTGENIFIVKNGRLVTPTVASGILEGITRRTVMELAYEHGIEVVERDVTRSELYNCDEAFFAGTAAEITPILSIDKRVIGSGSPGQITRKMMDLYSKAVIGQLPGHKDWLTAVYNTVQKQRGKNVQETSLPSID